jgi:RNA polymerase sigma-70 factor (ECF subfamily)
VRYFLNNRPEDAEDLIHEILVELLESLRAGRFDPNKGAPLGNYVSGITSHVIQEYFRGQRKRQKLSASLQEESLIAVNEEIALEKEELRQELRMLLKNLAPKYQEVLYLRFFEEMPVKDIAKKLNLPAERVSERINYAIKLAQKEIKKSKKASMFADFLTI